MWAIKMDNNYQTNLSNRIIDHLKQKQDGRDDLDGLVIAIYEKEMKRLTEKIMNDLADLIAKGVVAEYENNNGKRGLKLILKSV